MTLKLRNGTMDQPSTFNYKQTDNNQLIIEGILKSQGAQDTLSIQLSKKNLKDFLLVSRKFHWINERPFNR